MKLTHLRIQNFDYDRGSSDKNITDKSKELLALSGESPDASQSLLVADGVACFPKNREVDLKCVIPDCDTLVAEARKELGLSDDTDKPFIGRYVARKLTSQNPPVVSPSLKSPIEIAIAVVWKKSCFQVPSSPVSDSSIGRKDPGAA